ncbi:MAG: hypothetical protein IPI79_08830 [Moraxellaceae bacterium]|nr:hypothetical protein [Moraxellaceae bacterium]
MVICNKKHSNLCLKKTSLENFDDEPQRLIVWQQWLLQRQQWRKFNYVIK